MFVFWWRVKQTVWIRISLRIRAGSRSVCTSWNLIKMHVCAGWPGSKLVTDALCWFSREASQLRILCRPHFLTEAIESNHYLSHVMRKPTLYLIPINVTKALSQQYGSPCASWIHALCSGYILVANSLCWFSRGAAHKGWTMHVKNLQSPATGYGVMAVCY